MGAGASMDPSLAFLDRISNEGDRYFCHSCHRVSGLDTNQATSDLICPHCQSTFLEEVGENNQTVARHHHTHGQLTNDQSRRITNATAMLRLLESQLREELESLQQAFATASARMNEEGGGNKQKKLTKVMTSRLRRVAVNLDMACSQPSCPVCNEDFTIGNNVLRLPCSHIFHDLCVMPWLEMKQNCPICRAELSDIPPTEHDLDCCSVIELKCRLREFACDDETLTDKEKSELIIMLVEKYKEAHEAEIKVAADAASQLSDAVSFPIVLRSDGSGLGTNALHPRSFFRSLHMSPTVRGFGIWDLENASGDSLDVVAVGSGSSGPNGWLLRRRAIPLGELEEDEDNDNGNDDDGVYFGEDRLAVRYIPASATQSSQIRRPWERSRASSRLHVPTLLENDDDDGDDDRLSFAPNATATTTTSSTSSPLRRTLSSSSASTAGASVAYQIVPRTGGAGGYNTVAVRSASLPADALANILVGGQPHAADVHDRDDNDARSSLYDSHR